MPDDGSPNDCQLNDIDRLLAREVSSADQLQAAVIAGLLARRADQEFLTYADYKAAGDMVNRSARQVQRWMRDELRGQGEKTCDRRGPRFELDDLMIATVYAHVGRVHPAYLDLKAHGFIDCSATVFRDAWKRLSMAVQKFPKVGHQAIRGFGLYRVWSAPKPNFVLQLDSHQIDIFCNYQGQVVRPWMTDTMDDCSRFVPGALVTLGDATAKDIAATLAMSIRTRVGPDSKTVIGGKPAMVIFDCALANNADIIANGFASLDITPHPAAPYEPTVKGKKERYYRTFEAEAISDLEGFISPEAKTKEMDYLWVPSPDRLPPFSLVCERIDKFINRYNFERPHSGLGGKTPFEVLAEHAIEVEEVSAAMLARAFLQTTRGTYKVHKSGLYVHNRWYSGSAIAQQGGKQVIVRYLPDDPTFVEVFDEADHYLGRATCQNLMTADESDRVSAARDALTVQVNAYYSESLGIRADLTDLRVQGEDASVAEVARARHGSRGRDAAPKTGLRAADAGVVPGFDEVRNWDPNEEADQP